MRRRQRQSSFTLIEMLAVLAIMAIILSIGILSVTRIGQSMKLQTAGSELVNTLNQARQYAILHRANTAVVFSINPSLTSTNIAPLYTSYAVAVQCPGGNRSLPMNHSSTNFLVQGFTTNCTALTYLTRWKQLPKGLIFDCSVWEPGYSGNPYQMENWIYAQMGVVPPTQFWGYFGPIVSYVTFPTNNATFVKQGYMPFGYDGYQNSSIAIREGYYDPSQASLSMIYNGRVYTQGGGIAQNNSFALITNANVNCFNVYISWPYGQLVPTRK